MTHSFKLPGPNLIISFYRATSITSMPHGLSRVALASTLTIVVGKARATPVPVKIDELANTSNSTSGALLAPVFSVMQRDAVFWTAIAIAVLVNIVQGAITTLIDICEAEALWTVRFRLSLYEHLWWTGIAVTLIASFGSMVVSFLAGNTGESLGIILLSTASSLAVFRYAWPAWRNRHYCLNRWMAWTGPSRTGIEAKLVPYMGGPRDWRKLCNSVQVLRQHPVEAGIAWFYHRTESGPITTDPTDLLKAAHHGPQQTSNVSEQPMEKHSLTFQGLQKPVDTETTPNTPSIPDGVYAPVIPNQSVSLLWGIKLGFSPRVSRGVLSVPKKLLTSYPRTESDHDGRALCLAHGIFGRNKGLQPQTFILQLDLKKLEEKSVQWPRPSKVLRSYYLRDMQNMYGPLGDSFVNCATELALLLADTRPSIIYDWLAANLEHQDLDLNRRAAELGASNDDLQLLYRLSYAAMLVSLSSHALGHRSRPEMTIFKAYVTRVEGRPGLPEWACNEELQERLKNEHEGIDPRSDLDGLVEAVLPLYRFPPESQET
ncbi:hypothetical protein VKT23_017608 [Stygiomarasmius scandens]|uniref:Uncharacterized protein n=1 Tax=Marasmiellus scandens TaxID=2682957 RepID=A0ABR1IRR0_9AGAR